MSQTRESFSCREHYIKSFDPQSSEQAQIELSNLCTEKDIMQMWRSINYYSGIRRMKGNPSFTRATKGDVALVTGWSSHKMEMV